MSKKLLFSGALFAASLCINDHAKAQNAIGQNDSVNTITTAVPFLTVAPDARSAALGDAGVALSPDANSSHWNPGKLGFIEQDFSGSLSYTPWLRNIIDDMFLAYLSGVKKLGDNSAFSASLRYFDLGEIQFIDANKNPVANFNPKEYSIDLAYGQRLTENIGLGVGARFIRSNLSGNVNVSPNTESRPGNTAAVDIGIYYTNDFTMAAKDYNISFGANVSNIGGKISYTNGDRKDFIPANLRVGTAIEMDLDAFNSLTLAVDANKLLVPTPQSRNEPPSEEGVLSSIVSSFGDAPGGFSEEMKEINLSAGLEYWYNDLFAARGGYFYENPLKGDRQYFTLGAGIRYQKFGLDVAYLIPNQQNHPLANTLRFTISINFEKEDDGLLPVE